MALINLVGGLMGFSILLNLELYEKPCCVQINPGCLIVLDLVSNT